MAFEQLGKPRDYRDADEFNEIHAPAEGLVIDRVQALWPHGFNVRNTPGAAARKVNWIRNERRGRVMRDRSALQHGPPPQEVNFVGPPVPPPPWRRSTAFNLTGATPSTTATIAAPQAAPQLHITPAQPANTHSPGDPNAFSSYARTAHSILSTLWRYSVGHEFSDLNSTPTLDTDHPVIAHLTDFSQATVSKVLYILEQSSISDLQRYCIHLQPSVSEPLSEWTLDHSLFVRCCLRAHPKLVARYAPIPKDAERHLVVVNFASAPGLDRVSLNAIFNDPYIISLIAVHLRRRVGKPFLCWKNSATLGSHWFNAKRIAHLSGQDLLHICNSPCCCSAYPDAVKQDGHLLTTNCDILPSHTLIELGKMGAKYRPHDCPSYLNADTRSVILEVLHAAVSRFAREAEICVGTPGCMQAWKSEVGGKLETAVAAMPEGILLTPPGALPYSNSDRNLMSVFLRQFVCTWTLLCFNAPRYTSMTSCMISRLEGLMKMLMATLRL